MGKVAKRKRRKFTEEFKSEAVRIVRDSGKSVCSIARELDLTETALRRWVQQAEVDAGGGSSGALTTSEREELAQLRRENKRLRLEREILKKRRPSLPRKASEVRVHRGREGQAARRSDVRRARGVAGCRTHRRSSISIRAARSFAKTLTGKPE